MCVEPQLSFFYHVCNSNITCYWLESLKLSSSAQHIVLAVAVFSLSTNSSYDVMYPPTPSCHIFLSANVLFLLISSSEAKDKIRASRFPTSLPFKWAMWGENEDESDRQSDLFTAYQIHLITQLADSLLIMLLITVVNERNFYFFKFRRSLISFDNVTK